MTKCFICLINLHSVLIRIAQTNILSIFLPHLLTYQKSWVSLPVGYKRGQLKTGDWKWLWSHYRTFYFTESKRRLGNLLAVKQRVLKWRLLFVVARFCTPPELKLHVFSSSKHGKEKNSRYRNFFCSNEKHSVIFIAFGCWLAEVVGNQCYLLDALEWK